MTLTRKFETPAAEPAQPGRFQANFIDRGYGRDNPGYVLIEKSGTSGFPDYRGFIAIANGVDIRTAKKQAELWETFGILPTPPAAAAALNHHEAA